VIAVACAALTLPVLVGIGAAWKGRNDVAAVFAGYKALEAENSSYRQATDSLAGQISSLQAAVLDLGAQSALDPMLAQAMDRLPALVKARAMGGGSTDATPKSQEAYVQALTALTGPDDTFGLLRTLLEGLESRLVTVKGFVEKRNALAAATPSIWPANGWLTSTMGMREDPVTGADDFHAGLDIAAERGQPVYATAEGTVVGAEYHTDYGNLIVLNHGSVSNPLTVISPVQRHQRVRRFSAATSSAALAPQGVSDRAAPHYEVLANGRLLNPLQTLTQKRPRDR
jgi:murein DD-endopeptidase MepM/ murein hydrolase activator NlpD